MKKILVVFFLLISYFGFGQQVNAPDPKSFTVNTAGQDADGFSLSGFNATDILLCAIGLPSAPSGTTFYMTTTTSLTASTGYSMSGNKTRLAFTGTMANINNALATLKINTTATTGVVQISVSATVNPTGYYYLPTNGHFYKPMTWPSGSSYQGNNVTPYNNLKTLCTQQTFKGQSGYLMTITSSDEDNFVYNNVPGNNIIFALTDNAKEGTFVIDAGPESGTTIKTSNGTQGNVTGQYNNWAGGEPNNWGPGENYVVTKWSGGSQWNDYGPAATSFPGGISGYVIEFGTWTNPDDQTFTNFYNNSVSHSNGQTLRAQFNLSFGSSIDKTKFKTRIETSTDNTTFTSNNAYVGLNGVGRVDLTSQLDAVQVAGTGNKATISAGQVEYSYVNPNASWMGSGISRLLIDMRTFGNTAPSSISATKILDCYEGPVTFLSSDASWAQYSVPSPLTKVTDGTSSFNTNIRNVNGTNTDYAFTSTITFGQNMITKYHKLVVNDLSQTDLSSLLGGIITVGDVYLAFKEYSDKGILGNESRYFTTGIQFNNADVNEDGVFDERDCYTLLTHLQGTTSLWPDTPKLIDAMKLVPSSTYDNITKQNWNTYTNLKKTDYDFTFTNGVLNSYALDVAFKGDVNLSHSSQPTGFVLNSVSNNPSVSEIKSMAVKTNSIGNVLADIMMEKVGDSVVLTIDVNMNGNQVGATQFDVFFDNSVLGYSSTKFSNTSSTNFSRNNGSSISVGSLNTSGGTIQNIKYTVSFKSKTTLTNLLGLISIKDVETLNNNMTKLNVTIQ